MVVCYKAQLVIKGYMQQYRIDYVETFAPTVHVSTLHILLSFAAQKDAIVHQCDVKNVYLNCQLQDGITLLESSPKLPIFPWIIVRIQRKPNVISKWLISVYGSKQGAHDWYAKVKKFFIELGYMVSIAVLQIWQ